MQIHEITKKPLKEGLVGALAGGVASAMGKQLQAKAIGQVVDPSGQTMGREQGFQAVANSSAAKALATSMEKAWKETVQNFMANSKDASGNPPTAVSQISQPSVDQLKQNLEDLVNNMLGRQGANYKQLANYVNDPTEKAYTEKIVAEIDNIIDGIFKGTVTPVTPNVMTGYFTELVGKGVLPAQNILAYDTGRKGIGSGSVGGVALSSLAQQLANAAKLDNAEIASFQQAVKKLGITSANDPRIAELAGLQRAAE